jgi:predicted DNA-binding transcriptional regulator YafY
MLETSARLLRLLSLLQGRRFWCGAELASRLEVTTRTVRRDVDKLRTLGYPIRSSAGTEGGYQFSAGSTVPPLLLDEDEAVAVALGLGCAATGMLEGTGEASISALSKIEQILPLRLRRRVSALQTMVVTPSGARSSVEARTLSAIAGACRDQEILGFRYSDHCGTASARLVEPYRLVHTGCRWYLVGWDLHRRDWRTFRLDRIQGRLTTGRHFSQREPPARDLAAYVARGVMYAPPCRARIKLFVGGEVIAKRFPFWRELIEPVDEQSCFIEMAASTFESLAVHLALLEVDFQITEHLELVTQVRRLAARFRRATAPVHRARAGRTR